LFVDSVPVAGLSADDAALLIAGPVATQATLIVQVPHSVGLGVGFRVWAECI
jgi:hypothetical protein